MVALMFSEPVVAPNDLRLASPGNDLPRCESRARTARKSQSLDVQGFAIGLVDDVETPEVAAVLELVVYEVH